METRYLGHSGFQVPVLSFGTATFGGKTEHFGGLDVTEATRIVDVCLDLGLNMFDTADLYGDNTSETILGQAIQGRRDKVIVSTKATFRTGVEPNDVGSSRFHLIRSVETSLRRLGTDYLDLFQLHGFDARTPVEETLSTLNDLVHAGKIRYLGCSNFSGWHLMKSLAIADQRDWTRYVAHQAFYSLVGRDYEWELMPLAIDQHVGCVVWSPLGWGRLTGKVRRGQPMPDRSRLRSQFMVDIGPQIPNDYLFDVVDVLEAVAGEIGKTVSQVALNWLLSRPTVTSIIVGARTPEQLRENVGALGWSLDGDQIARLDRVSQRPMAYPYWHQAGFAERNPFPVA